MRERDGERESDKERGRKIYIEREQGKATGVGMDIST